MNLIINRLLKISLLSIILNPVMISKSNANILFGKDIWDSLSSSEKENMYSNLVRFKTASGTSPLEKCVKSLNSKNKQIVKIIDNVYSDTNSWSHPSAPTNKDFVQAIAEFCKINKQ